MNSAQYNVLILEDNPGDCELAVERLQNVPDVEFELISAATLAEGLGIINDSDIDAVILDLNLPDSQGIDTLTSLQKKRRDIPVLILSGSEDEDLRRAAFNSGVQDFIGKNEPPAAMLARSVVYMLDRHRVNEQLRQTMKMEAIGRLAGGVAHDFNNLLSVIIGYTDLLLEDDDELGNPRELLLEISKASQRAADLTRQLLVFSRKSINQRSIFSLNKLLQDLESLLTMLIGEDIQLELVLDPDLGNIEADPGQIEQVIMNLIANARDAMPRGGQLTIETRGTVVEKSPVSADSEILPGRYALLVVSDTGEGMDSETRRRIFEPFFTTKVLGKGTGLGLATSYGIISQNQGYIDVISEPGYGTSFRIHLPLKEGISAPESPREERPTSMSGSETVLLVEDEIGVRRYCRQVLQSRGYKVLEADSPQHALQIEKEYEGNIHCLLTDVVMPGMGGRELAEQIITSRPAIRVLYISGYTDDAVMRHGIHSSSVCFLQKPFTAAGLARSMRKMLDMDEAPPYQA